MKIQIDKQKVFLSIIFVKSLFNFESLIFSYLTLGFFLNKITLFKSFEFYLKKEYWVKQLRFKKPLNFHLNQRYKLKKKKKIFRFYRIYIQFGKFNFFISYVKIYFLIK